MVAEVADVCRRYALVGYWLLLPREGGVGRVRIRGRTGGGGRGGPGRGGGEFVYLL